MKIKEEIKNYQSKSTKSLYQELKKEYEQLQQLQFSDRFHKVKDVSKIKKTKHKIARIYTILREKLKEK